MSLRPIPAQRAVGTRPGKAGTRCTPCRKRHFLGIDRRMLCLLGVGTLQQESVARESQKFPPKNRPCVSLNWSTGNRGEYVYRCAVRLPARNSSDPGYAIIVRLTDGIGPLKPAYGIWQEAQARFLKGDMFSSKFSQLAEHLYCLISGALKCWRLTCQRRRINARAAARASLKMRLTSRRTLAISDSKSGGRMPGGLEPGSGGYGLYGGKGDAVPGGGPGGGNGGPCWADPV